MQFTEAGLTRDSTADKVLSEAKDSFEGPINARPG
jgi:hypothetical protein